LQDEAWQSLGKLFFSLSYSVLEMPASVLIAWAVRRFSRPNDDLQTILLWISATFIISILDAFTVAGAYAFLTQQPIMKTIWYGFFADVTGVFFATTVVMGFINNSILLANVSWKSRMAGLGLLVMLCVVTIFIFSHNITWFKTAPALYFALSCLPIALTLVLSVLWGNLGGSIGLLTLGTIVIHYTDQYQGPFFIRNLNLNESLLLALSYLSAAALLVVFLRVLRRSTNRFNPVTGRLSGNGILYRLEPETGIFNWEDNISSLLDSSLLTDFNTISKVLAHVHPLDREKLRKHWLTTHRRQHDAVIFRIKLNNNWLTLVDSGGITMANAGKLIIVGNWQTSHYDLDL